MTGKDKKIADLELQIEFYRNEISKCNKVNIELTEQLRIGNVSKRSLADIEIEYSHPTGKKKGKLKYDDDDETLILDYKGGFITLPNIDDCNVC